MKIAKKREKTFNPQSWLQKQRSLTSGNWCNGFVAKSAYSAERTEYYRGSLKQVINKVVNTAAAAGCR